MSLLKKILYSTILACLLVILSLPTTLAATTDPFGGLINTASGATGINPGQYSSQYAPNISKETTIQGGFGTATNFIVGFLGLVAIIFLMYGGFTYMIANGEQGKIDKGKKIIWQTIVGILIMFSVYAVVNTVLNISAAINPNARISIGPLQLQNAPGGGTLQLPL